MSTEQREPGDEPLDELMEALRGAWQQLPSPAPDRPLADEDPSTRRAVHWMREAWLALPVPAAAAPQAAPRRLAHARWLRVAAAAALLLALGVPVLVAVARRSSSRPGTVTPITSADPAAPSAPTGTATSSATIVAVDAHHLELRSGPVRLYLLTDPLPPHEEVPR